MKWKGNHEEAENKGCHLHLPWTCPGLSKAKARWKFGEQHHCLFIREEVERSPKVFFHPFSPSCNAGGRNDFVLSFLFRSRQHTCFIFDTELEFTAPVFENPSLYCYPIECLLGWRMVFDKSSTFYSIDKKGSWYTMNRYTFDYF